MIIIKRRKDNYETSIGQIKINLFHRHREQKLLSSQQFHLHSVLFVHLSPHKVASKHPLHLHHAQGIATAAVRHRETQTAHLPTKGLK